MDRAARYIIEPAEVSTWNRLACALARLPLMKRYGRDEAHLAQTLADSCGPGGAARVLWAREPGSVDPAGLVWFYDSGTFGMGGYLKLLSVFCGHRRQGLGLRLLHAAERQVARRSALFFLLVTADNTQAIGFYERAGYIPCGRLSKLVLPDADELIYYKRLKGPSG